MYALMIVVDGVEFFSGFFYSGLVECEASGGLIAIEWIKKTGEAMVWQCLASPFQLS